MGDDDPTESPLDRADEEVGAAVADDPEALMASLPHYYRGEVAQATAAQDRLDQTTNWAITVIVGLLSIVFSSPEMPAYLVLIGIVALGIFLSYEVRRYRFFDLYRSRVRFFQENVFANALEPAGAEHPRWREELGRDLRSPTFKVTVREALSRRLSRIYWQLFAVLGVAWIAKVTLFTPESRWTEAAGFPGVSGRLVAAGLAAFYLGLFVLVKWPGERQAKGEVYGEEPGAWKDE